MDRGLADDVVYLALTGVLAAALTLTLRLRDRRAAARPGPALAAGGPAAAPAGAPHRLPPPRRPGRPGAAWAGRVRPALLAPKGRRRDGAAS
jgi:hypothetical protein